jgi:membrane dipeptidase
MFNTKLLINRTMLYLVPASLLCMVYSCGHKTLSDDSLDYKARMIHARVLTLDSHTDTPMRLMHSGSSLRGNGGDGQSKGKVDLIRMMAGGLDAAFFAVFIGQGERTPEGNETAIRHANEIFDTIVATTGREPELCSLAYSPRDAYDLQKKGKRAIYIGIENGYALGNDISLVGYYYNRGARYITLCHTKNNDLCDSSTDKNGPEHDGLSEFGKQVVAEMNLIGMMVDVSHMSDKSFSDVMALSKAPVIASHSCARAVCDNPRNLTDEQLHMLALNGGVIQVCLLSDYVRKPETYLERDSAQKVVSLKYNDFVGLSDDVYKKALAEWHAIDAKYPPRLAAVSDLVDHIDHIVKVAGIDYVGIGSDFDGGGGLSDCGDVSQMGNITRELVKRGYSEEQIRKIWGGNFMRVFREVERISRKENIL